MNDAMFLKYLDNSSLINYFNWNIKKCIMMIFPYAKKKKIMICLILADRPFRFSESFFAYNDISLDSNLTHPLQWPTIDTCCTALHQSGTHLPPF